MNLRGTVVGPVTERTVSTRYGERDLAEVPLRTGGEETTVTLWGSWAETAALLEPGTDLRVTAVAEDEYDGRRTYATTGESYVVVEPEVLVVATTIRGWADCPRLPYLNSLTGLPLAYPVVRGTIVHEVFGDLLRGRDREAAIADRVEGRGLELGLLGESPETVTADVREHARAIEGWLAQGRFAASDTWRSEQLLIADTVGIRGRADAVRGGTPVELKTGKNLRAEPRFKDKIQAACYALALEERGETVDTGTVLYTKNATLDRGDASGDLGPAKDFAIKGGLLSYVVRLRNEIAAILAGGTVPTGHEGTANCEHCFEQDTCQVVAGRLDQEAKAGSIGVALPEPDRAHFDSLAAAIRAERREIHREYAGLWEDSAADRAADDRALIDLEPGETTELETGRWELRARRQSGASSKLREGDLVLASDGDPVAGRAEVARIERLEPGDPEVVLTADEPVPISRIDVYPTEIGVDRHLVALHDVLLTGDERRRDVLLGRTEPAFEPVEGTVVESNPAQDEAVRRALGARDFAIVHGPPGTGKTHTIARLVEALLERGERVLLSAFTNRAVDNALEAVLERGVEDVRRVGSRSGVRPDMQPHRLPRSGDPATRAAELESAGVVAATTASCGSRAMRTQSFDVAVVDEAAQLTEPGTYAAIALADRFVLVGDHHQLPPVVRSGGELAVSLFARLHEQAPDAATLLDRQYRMNQRIQAFPSREFYDGALHPASREVATRSLEDLDGVDRGRLPEELRDPVTFLDVPGDGAAQTDREEAARIAEVIAAYEAAGVPPGEIGVIAPFRAQVGVIEERVPRAVTVDTVDRFQGSSSEVIVVSFVATGSLEGPIFEDHRRLNVALTRAKRALVLVGDARALGEEPVYERMLEWARR